jgi:hypothetical protein
VGGLPEKQREQLQKGSALRLRPLSCPIYNRVYECFSLPDRIQSGGANADRNCSALPHGPPPTTRKAHFNDRETDAAMFHGVASAESRLWAWTDVEPLAWLTAPQRSHKQNNPSTNDGEE